MSRRAPAWRYTPLPRGHPSGCLHCQAQDVPLIKAQQGRVWVATLCGACTAVHQRDHAVQLWLFAQEETRR